MELQRGRRVKVPGGMELGSRVLLLLLLLHVIPGDQRSTSLSEGVSLLFSFDVFSRESTVQMRARRFLALRAIDDCILSVVDTHDDCEIREFSNRSLARGVQDLRETVVVVVGGGGRVPG
jgi:hypothetical protein